MLLVNFGAIAIRFNTIEDHGVRIKALEVKDAGRDVAAGELRKDLEAINNSIKDLKEEVRQRASPAPQIVLPPGYHLMPQQFPAQGGRASVPAP